MISLALLLIILALLLGVLIMAVTVVSLSNDLTALRADVVAIKAQASAPAVATQSDLDNLADQIESIREVINPAAPAAAGTPA